MFDSPSSLQDCCIDFICDNIVAVSERQPLAIATDDDEVMDTENQDTPELQQQAATAATTSTSEATAVAQSDPNTVIACAATNSSAGGEVFIHRVLSERLLERLGDKGLLADSTLALFDARRTALSRVRLRNTGRLSAAGLRTLRAHRITELEAPGLPVDVLLGCLGRWSVEHLRALNVSRGTFDGRGTFRVFVAVSLQRLRNLRALNVGGTEFNTHFLEVVASDLPLLDTLDISCTKVSDISALRKCKERLRSLSMFSLRDCRHEDCLAVILELGELRHLDVSDAPDESMPRHPTLVPPLRACVTALLRKSALLPHLASLDISGNESVEPKELRSFLDRHPSLAFLGLMQMSSCADAMFTDATLPNHRKDLVVTGNGSEQQIMEALQRYSSRAYYFQKSLFALFQLTQAFTEARVDIIQLIIPGMRAHPKHLGIQMAATACLYNLSKGEMGQKIHPCWLQKVAELTMTAMENFSSHQQLQKNTLLTLCSDRILQDVTFDKYKCARLVLDCLCAYDDASMNRMCVAICSILAAKISTSEISQLVTHRSYMQKLLNIVKSKVESGVVDITMKFTLSALWNLTDESPESCSIFLEEKGLHLFLSVLERFPNDSAVETKVLGLMNNIAEVRHLRSELMIDNFIDNLRSLLRSTDIDVSYFAAGIIAHLASDGDESWKLKHVNCHQILEELSQVVMHWETPEGEMVAYRSLSPFFPLLKCRRFYQVQLWAVWAMQHVCNRNSKRYCPMLIAEGGVEILFSLVEDPQTNSHVLTISRNILDNLESKGPFYVSKCSQLLHYKFRC